MGCSFSGLRQSRPPSHWSGIKGGRTVIPSSRVRASRMSSRVTIVALHFKVEASGYTASLRGPSCPLWFTPLPSDFQDYRHDQWPLLRLLRNISLQIGANFFFDHAVIRAFFFARLPECLHNNIADLVHESVFARRKPTSHNLRRNLNFPR